MIAVRGGYGEDGGEGKNISLGHKTEKQKQEVCISNDPP